MRGLCERLFSDNFSFALGILHLYEEKGLYPSFDNETDKLTTGES